MSNDADLYMIDDGTAHGPAGLTVRYAVDPKAAVMAYLAEHPQTEVFDRYQHFDAPVFVHCHDDGSVRQVGPRPELTAVSLDLLDATTPYTLLSSIGVNWDGECLTMPGDLRYRPIGLDASGGAVVCRRVGP